MLKFIPPSSEFVGIGQDPSSFREGMSRVASAIHLITTDGTAGRAGFTATAVTPVTDRPASLLVCANAGGHTSASLKTNGVFCVNTLGHRDLPLADRFAGRTEDLDEDRFAVGTWQRLVTGSPVLTSALVAFDCRVIDARLVATHHVIIGEVVAMHLGEQQPALVYRERNYHEL